MNLDPSYFYVRSDNNEPEGEVYNVWFADTEEKAFLHNPALAELMYDERGLWGRDAADSDWHHLHGFDDPSEVIYVGLKRLLFAGELELPTAWTPSRDSRPRVEWDVMELDQWSAYWRGSRFVFHCDKNRVICTHIYWLAGPIQYLEQYLLGQNLIEYMEMHNILEW
jgi:hypothetical protein